MREQTSVTVSSPDSERALREGSEALGRSSPHHQQLTAKAQRAEAALRVSEAELRARVEELSRFNRVAVDRESRLIELKREINEFAIRHGEPLRYVPTLESDGIPDVATRIEASGQASVDVEGVPLEVVLCTDELTRRPHRRPDYDTENHALLSLVTTLAQSPREILQALAQTILNTLQADSAGLSFVTPDATRFYWPAIAGQWSLYVGGGTPRDFGPSGDVLDRDAPLLFRKPERRYHYLKLVSPAIEEALLVPFYDDGKAVGTLWAVAHGGKQFDAEDLRQLLSLSRFASAAYQASEFRVFEQARRAAALNLMEDAVSAREAAEKAERESRELAQQTRELADSLAHLNRRKDEFLAMLSHELRNPLASIRNAAQIMRLQEDGNPIRIAAQGMIDRQVSQLVRLIDDLLEVSRIATGRCKVELERVDFRAIVHRAVETIRPQAERMSQSLAEPLTDAAPLWLQGDAVRLEQVVVNLLSNASKYTNRGGRISLTLQEESGAAVLRVQDTGVGIAPEMLPRIFELFMQVDASLDRAQGGLGIGLALAKSLVELHAGSIEVCSTLGQGSEFVVRLPMQLAVPLKAWAPAASTPSAARTLKVVIVDDSVDAAESLRVILETFGHEIHLAHDGAAALDVVRMFVPDIVLLDIGLPILDGYEVARRIRADRSLDEVVLVALTGYGQDADKQLAKKAGFDHHLVKPVDFENLDRVLASVASGGQGPDTTGAA